ALCCRRLCVISVFFFFQAEDGIRDFHVTGVQTCALPISRPVGGWVRSFPRRPSSRRRGSPWSGGGTGRRRGGRPSSRGTRARWEIGRASCRKECRSRRAR